MKKQSLFNGAAVTALALAASAGNASPFSPGTIVVVRVGDGAAALSGNATATFLEERSPVDGSLIQIIALPTAANGLNAPFANSGTATSEAFLSQSPNNQFLFIAGYAATPGTASITTSTTIARVVAKIDVNGNVDTTTQLVASGGDGNTGNPRSVCSDGTNVWVGTSAGGTRYTTVGTNAASSQICSTPLNQRVLKIFNGQLYGSSASGTFVNVFTIGTGLPTSGPQPASSLAGMPQTGTHSNYDYFFADANTLYVADDGTVANGGGIQKWTFDAGSGIWSLQYTFSPGASGNRGLSGKVTAGVTTLWATSIATGTPVWTVTDTGSGATPTQLTSAATNTAFRGIRVLPGTFGGVNDGACCFADGSCSVATSAGCASLGGSYQGNFTTCGAGVCPQPGSCCMADHTCLILSSGQCATAGGTFGGSGSSCSTANCGTRSGACCTGGNCTIATSAACTGGGGTYRGDGATCGSTSCGVFSGSNLVVLEVGDGSAIVNNAATPIFAKEIRISDGATIQSIGLPAARTETGNRAATVNAVSTTEGQLTRSVDGRYVFVAAYNATTGTSNVPGSNGSRVAARIDASGVVNTTTAFTDGTFQGSSPRGAISTNGTDIWLCGDATNLANRGIRYATFGSNSSLQLNTDGTGTGPTNNRCINIFFGNLYFSSGSTPTGVNQLGTGLPTTNGQTVTNLTGNLDPEDFFFADPTTLYTASRAGGTGPAGVAKYTYDGFSWLLQYTLDGSGALTVPIQSLTGHQVNGITTLYGTTGVADAGGLSSPGNQLVSITDNGSDASSPLTIIATAPTNRIWKGLDFTPVAGLTCYANCDGSTGVPFLNVADFTCFLQKFSTGNPYANCDNSTSPPTLNVADFTCFLQKFSLGCSAP